MCGQLSLPCDAERHKSWGDALAIQCEQVLGVADFWAKLREQAIAPWTAYSRTILQITPSRGRGVDDPQPGGSLSLANFEHRNFEVAAVGAMEVERETARVDSAETDPYRITRIDQHEV